MITTNSFYDEDNHLVVMFEVPDGFVYSATSESDLGPVFDPMTGEFTYRSDPKVVRVLLKRKAQ